MPTKYNTLVQPHKKLPIISPPYGIYKKRDYSKVEDCNIIKQLLNAAYRHVHAPPPHMHTNTHIHTTVLPFLCPHHPNQSHIASIWYYTLEMTGVGI